MRTTGRPRSLTGRPEINSVQGKRSDLPRVYIEVSDQRLAAIIDTAASCSFINSQVLPEGYALDETVISTNLAADNMTMRITGKIRLNIELGGKTFACDTLVAPELRAPFLLGLRWLQQEEVVIDFGRNALYARKNERTTIPLIGAPLSKKVLIIIDSDQLQHQVPNQHLLRFQKVIRENAQVFSPPAGKLSRTRSVRHIIKLTNDQPFRIRPYEYSDVKRREIEKQVQKMLSAGIIEQCASPYSSPVVLANKSDGKFRFCVDYRRLNSITEDIAQPILRIIDAVKDLGIATIFTTIDLKSGYWQVPMDEIAKKYTAFSTPSGGTYHFNVMSFGLKGAPGTFQRLMTQEVLAGLQDICRVYLDDVIITHDHGKNTFNTWLES